MVETGGLNESAARNGKASGTTVTVAEGFPCIDLYARPRKARLIRERLNRAEGLWIAGALIVALLIEGIFVREQIDLSARVHERLQEIIRLETQKTCLEAARSKHSRQMEKTRGIEGRLAARSGWLRLLQAISSATSDREVLEQMTIDGTAQRGLQIAGAAQDLPELQAMLLRLKSLRCMKSVRLLETVADKSLGAESIHFRIEAHCDAADLNKETSAK